MGKRLVNVCVAIALGKRLLIDPGLIDSGKNKVICDNLVDYKQLVVVDRWEVWISCLVYNEISYLVLSWNLLLLLEYYYITRQVIQISSQSEGKQEMDFWV